MAGPAQDAMRDPVQLARMADAALPRDILVSVEQKIPGGLSAEDWTLLQQVLDLILLHAFFRPHLAMMPLRFANPSPPSGWIEDFHLQAVVQYSAHQRKPRVCRGFELRNKGERLEGPESLRRFNTIPKHKSGKARIA